MNRDKQESGSAAFVVLLAVVVGFGGGTFLNRPDPVVSNGKIVRTEYQDKVGRDCVQVASGNRLAIDCDWPPAESRARTLLDQLAGNK